MLSQTLEISLSQSFKKNLTIFLSQPCGTSLSQYVWTRFCLVLVSLVLNNLELQVFSNFVSYFCWDKLVPIFQFCHNIFKQVCLNLVEHMYHKIEDPACLKRVGQFRRNPLGHPWCFWDKFNSILWDKFDSFFCYMFVIILWDKSVSFFWAKYL